MTSRSLTHRSLPNRSKTTFRGVEHRTWRVVHRTHEHACEWNRHIMFGTDNILRLRLFQSTHTFDCKQVGPGARHDCRSDSSMEINHHLSLCCLTTYSMIEANYLLIIALHEINLDSFNSPFLKLIQCWF